MKEIKLGEISFKIFNTLFMTIIVLITLYPFYYVIISSLNDPLDLLREPVYLIPRKFSLVNYEYVLSDKNIVRATVITILRTVIGSVCAVLFTAAFAYGISRQWLLGRKFFITMALITMYFSGGLIPTYIVIARFLKLRGNFLVYILPNLFSAFNAFVMMTFFKGIEHEIIESAQIDGANDIVIFFKLILPLSTPILATIALFNAVWHWNSWFDALLYGGPKLETLPLYLVRAIQAASAAGEAGRYVSTLGITTLSVRLATMVIASFPIVIAYPFLQRYFVKGLMLGAIR
ncbi:MAG: carbohydrate ABC transporter permease [Candidatus Methanomethylicia archaeon]